MKKQMNDEELFIPKTKYKALKIILAVLLIGGLITLGYFIYKEKFCNPNTIVANLIENIEKQASKVLDTNQTGNEMYKMNGLIKVNGNFPSEYHDWGEIIKQIDLQFSGEIDSKNNIENVLLSTKYKDQELIDVNIFAEKENIYFLLNGLYDKYLKLSLENDENNTNLSNISNYQDDAKLLFNSYLKAIKQALNNLDYKRESTTIKVNEQDVNVYNNYTELDETKTKKLLKDILNNLASDNDFNTVWKKQTDSDSKEVINKLMEEIDKIKMSNNYQLNFYTNKNPFNTQLISIRLNEKNNNPLFIMDIISNDELYFSFNNNDLNVSIKIKKNSMVFNINLEAILNDASIKIDINTNYEKIKEVTKPDITNSINIQELTEEDKKIIEEKLQNNEGLIALIQDISKIIPIQE